METWQKPIELKIEEVVVNERMICLFTCDGATVSFSLSLVQELAHAEQEPLRQVEIINDAQAVYWPKFDKTITLSEIMAMTTP